MRAVVFFFADITRWHMLLTGCHIIIKNKTIMNSPDHKYHAANRNDGMHIPHMNPPAHSDSQNNPPSSSHSTAPYIQAYKHHTCNPVHGSPLRMYRWSCYPATGMHTSCMHLHHQRVHRPDNRVCIIGSNHRMCCARSSENEKKNYFFLSQHGEGGRGYFCISCKSIVDISFLVFD